MIVYNNIYNNRQGSVLVYTLVILMISSILFSGFIGLVTSQIHYASKKTAREEALNIAESGIYFYRWYLAHQVEGRTKQQIQDFWENGTPYGVDTPYVADYEGIGEYSIHVVPPSGNSTIAIVESTGHAYRDPEGSRTIRVRFRQPSWSEFSVLCDGDIRFGDGTEVQGPIHSNGGIFFEGVAHNVVSSAREVYDNPDIIGMDMHDGVWTNWTNEYNTNMGSDVFLGGKEFPVTGPSFNGVTGDLAFIKEATGCSTAGSYCSNTSHNGNLYFNNYKLGRHIRLNGDGTVDVRTVKSVNSNLEISGYSGGWATYTIPDDGVIFVEDNVWVDGRIDGKALTIVAADISGGVEKSIYLKDDIIYTQYDGSESLGLIAQHDIDVTLNSEDNLRIDAALLAQNGRVGRPNYGATDHKDSITVFGSIATRGRYGFAWTNGFQDWGYADRNIVYDNNFLYTPPPYFPTGTHYAIDLWEEI